MPLPYSSASDVGAVVTYPEIPTGMPGPLLWQDPTQNLASNNVTTQLPKMGSVRRETGNRWFVYCIASEAIAEGNLVAPSALTQATTITLAADLQTMTGFSGLLPNQWKGGLAYNSAVSAGAGDGFGRRIASNTATTVILERPSPVAWGGTATVQLFHPYYIRLTPSASGITQKVLGISYGAIAAPTGTNMWTAGGVSYGGWIQFSGLCDMVKAGAAISVANGALTASAATAGVAIGVGAGDVTTAFVFGHIAYGFAYDAYVPAYLTNCHG